VSGGLGCLVATGLVVFLTPQLRQYGRDTPAEVIPT
jgi:hypothetical protein